MYITTVSYRMQEKVAVNVPRIRSAALSMYCNFRNVCISKNEILGILPQLKFNIPGDFFPPSCNTPGENGLLSLQVSGAHLQKKKKKKAFRARTFSVEKVILWEAFIHVTVLMPFLNKTLHDYGIAYLHITLICKILYEFLVFSF